MADKQTQKHDNNTKDSAIVQSCKLGLVPYNCKPVH